MDLTNVSAQKRTLLLRIEENEKTGKFDVPVEDDLPSAELLPENVDYLCEKGKSRFLRWVANRIGDNYFLHLIRKKQLIIDGVTGKEHLAALEKGAIITCNHFSVADHYIVYHCLHKAMPKKYLYKIIREGNYTNFKGVFGFLFRHCNTLPLSRNRRTMIDFMSAVQTLLKNGESILVYPEQEMWWNYRKPRPFKVGGFKLAARANVPVLPVFITMQDDKNKLDKDGYPVQRHTLHILPPVYPDGTLGEKAQAEKMRDETYALYKEKYEEVYQMPLVFRCDRGNV